MTVQQVIWLDKNWKWILAALALAVVALVVFNNRDFFATVYFPADDFLRRVDLPIWAMVLVFMVLYALKGAVLVVSAMMLYIAAGVLFPTWVAILVTYAGLIVSLSVGYFIGRKLGESRVNKMIAKRKKLSAFFHGNSENLVSLCFVARLFPMSYGLVSMFFGALKVPFFKYLLMSLLGISPRMIPIVLAGAAITNPLSAEFLVPFGLSLGISFCIFMVYKTIMAAKV